MALATTTDYARLVEELGVRPLPDDLLGQALTHASYLNEADATATSNERLEFLGDSVLGMVIASVLFDQFPGAGEGDLTRMRADIVRGTSLARVANRVGLGQHMILGRGEEAAGGRHRDRNLAGAVEAMIGAVYEAHGYRAAKAFTRRLLKPELEQIRRRRPRRREKFAATPGPGPLARTTRICDGAGSHRRDPHVHRGGPRRGFDSRTGRGSKQA